MIIIIGDNPNRTAIRMPFRVAPNQELVAALQALVGAANVVLK